MRKITNRLNDREKKEMIRINPTTIKQNFSRMRFGLCRLTAYQYIVFLYILYCIFFT